MNKKKIKLYTNFQADYIYGGGAIVRKLLPIFQSGIQTNWTYFKRAHEDKQQRLQQNNVKYAPIELWSYKKGIRRFQKEYEAITFFCTAFCQAIKNRIFGYTHVWIVLDPGIIDFAYWLLRFSKSETVIHISVHDDCRIDYPSEKPTNLTRIGRILTRAKSIDVIGENLQQEYLKEFKVESFVFRRGVLTPPPYNAKTNSTKLHLIFVGSSHSDECWNILLKHLSTYNIEFHIKVFGASNFQKRLNEVPTNVSFMFMGNQPENEILSKHNEFDAAIFFWDFFSENRIKYSVSTKLTTYLQMGLPIIGLIHPDNESHQIFNYGAGIDITDPKCNITNYLNNTNISENINRYVSSKFNENVMLRNFVDNCILFR